MWNQRKHRVSFEEAESVSQRRARASHLDDPEHSTTEARFVLAGSSIRFRVLLVVHSYREQDAVIRIISARRATKQERSRYDQRWKP